MNYFHHVELIFRNLNIINTLRLKGKIMVCKKVQVGIGEGHNIINHQGGRLVLGTKYPKSGFLDSLWVFGKNATLIIKGNFLIYTGFRISVNDNAILELGSGYINYSVNIHCSNSIKIGENVAIAENVSIRDSDNHELLYQGYEMSKPIEIGDNVWIGMNTTILKGVQIGNGAVIAAGSIVTRNIPENCLAAGVPAKVIKTNVSWK